MATAVSIVVALLVFIAVTLWRIARRLDQVARRYLGEREYPKTTPGFDQPTR